MVLPRWLARFNRSVTNRILGRIPRRWSPFVIIFHQGRKSGKPYATLGAAFRTPDGFVLTPTYGPDCDWVRNVLTAKSFAIDRRGTTRRLHNARLIPRSEAWRYLPAPVRVAMRALRVEWYICGDG